MGDGAMKTRRWGDVVVAQRIAVKGLLSDADAGKLQEYFHTKLTLRSLRLPTKLAGLAPTQGTWPSGSAAATPRVAAVATVKWNVLPAPSSLSTQILPP